MTRDRPSRLPAGSSIPHDQLPPPGPRLGNSRVVTAHQTTSTLAGSRSERRGTIVAQRSGIDQWPQSLPFSCGPSALGSVLTALGGSPERGRLEEELAIWRESTAVGCPGTHPFGLALAAARRGFVAEVHAVGPRPWLWLHIRRQHRMLTLRQYRAVEGTLARDCRRAGVRVGAREGPRRTAGAGLLLVRVPSRIVHNADPHWIGLVPAEGSVLVMDPLRRRPYRSGRTVRERWDASGFDGTRTWVALRRKGVSASPRPDDAKSSAQASHPPSGHDHPRHLARRGWSREEALAWLESPDRRATQDPQVIWARVGLAAGETVVEVGAGTGYFAVSAARRVGPSGRVYAVDVSGELVDLLHERRSSEALPQLLPIRSTTDSIPIQSGVADVLLLANVLHDIPASTLSEAVRLLGPAGRAVNVDWKKQETPGGPPLDIRFSPDQASTLLAEQGLTEIDRWEFGPWHYGLTFRRGATRRTRVHRKES